MRISDWSSYVCSSDLRPPLEPAYARADMCRTAAEHGRQVDAARHGQIDIDAVLRRADAQFLAAAQAMAPPDRRRFSVDGERGLRPRDGDVQFIGLDRESAALQHELDRRLARRIRSEEHTSELQSLMRISYAVFCLKKKITKKNHQNK